MRAGRPVVDPLFSREKTSSNESPVTAGDTMQTVYRTFAARVCAAWYLLSSVQHCPASAEVLSRRLCERMNGRECRWDSFRCWNLGLCRSYIFMTLPNVLASTRQIPKWVSTYVGCTTNFLLHIESTTPCSVIVVAIDKASVTLFVSPFTYQSLAEYPKRAGIYLDLYNAFIHRVTVT